MKERITAASAALLVTAVTFAAARLPELRLTPVELDALQAHDAGLEPPESQESVPQRWWGIRPSPAPM